MKILVVGAGALGGYFGGRLHEKGEDVTFLVREKREKQLEENGLVIKSVNGDLKIKPKTTKVGDNNQYDLIIFGTKAYHLSEAIEQVKPFVHNETVILPVLNGVAHIKQLQKSFSEHQIIGGVCYIESTLAADGTIHQTSDSHHLLFGELNGASTERINKINDVFSNTKGKFKLTHSINEELWSKFLFITTLSGVTTLFRQPAGPINHLSEGKEIVRGILNEIATIMRAEGAPIPNDIEEKQFARFESLHDTMKSSMQRDMEKGFPIEADHLQGFLLKKAEIHAIPCPILTTIYANLKLYEQTIH